MRNLFRIPQNDPKTILIASAALLLCGAVVFVVGMFSYLILVILGSMLFGFGVGLFVEWRHTKLQEHWKCPVCGYSCDGSCGS